MTQILNRQKRVIFL